MESPTSLTKGTIIIVATVCETKVATTRIKIPKIAKTTKASKSATFFAMPWRQLLKDPSL